MDPISISAAVTGIVFNLAKVGKSLAMLYETYKTSQRTIFFIQTECTTIAAALGTLQSQSQGHRYHSGNIPQDLIAALDLALTGCGMTLEVLMEELEALLSKVGGEMKVPKDKGKWMKIGKSKQIAYVWNEESMLGLLRQLRGQSAAMMLVLRAMDAVTIERILEILERGKGTLEDVKSGAVSLREVEARKGGTKYPASVLESSQSMAGGWTQAGGGQSIYELFGDDSRESVGIGREARTERERGHAKVLQTVVRTASGPVGPSIHTPPFEAQSQYVPAERRISQSEKPQYQTQPLETFKARPDQPEMSNSLPIIQRQPITSREVALDEELASEDMPWLLKGRSSTRQNLEGLLSNFSSPGIAIGILYGQRKETHVVGVRKQGNSTPVTQADKFPISAITQAMTMTLLARIIDKPDNDLDWDTPIADALPSNIRHRIHPAHQNTTLERLGSPISQVDANLLTAENGSLWSYITSRGVTGHAGRLAIAQSILSRPPGPSSGMDICFANTALVALAIETATNSTWEAAMQKEIFQPLEMYHSGFGHASAERNSGDGDPVQPWPHNVYPNPNPTVGSDGVLKRSVVYAGPDPGTSGAVNPLAIWPACGVHASISDVLAFCDVHMRGFREDESAFGFLRKETFEKLHGEVGVVNNTRCTRSGMWLLNSSWVTKGRALELSGTSHGGAGKICLMPEMGRVFAALANVSGNVGEDLTNEALMICVRKNQGEEAL